MASSKSMRTPVLGDRADGYPVNVSNQTESMSVSTSEPIRCCRREAENTRYQGFKYLDVTGVAMIGWQWSHRIIRNSMGSGAQCIIVQRRAFFFHMTICARCCGICDETRRSTRWKHVTRSIGHARHALSSLGQPRHQVTWWWKTRRSHSSEWSQTVDKRIPRTNGRTAMTRASGRLILRGCYVLELYSQNSLVVLWGECSRCSEPDGSTGYSNQRSANEATSHDGSFSRYRESAMFANPPESLGARGLKKTTDVRPIVRDGSGSPHWWGAQRRRQSTISKHFINSTEIVSAATTPSGAIEIACY